MKTKSMWASLITIVVVTVITLVSFGLGARPRLGLDLEGGISAVYTPVFAEGEQPENLDEVLTRTIAVIRSRVDSLGVAEPEISRVGTDINVQLPGVEDADRANAIIGRTAQLGFYPVESMLLPATPEYNETASCVIETIDESGATRWVANPDRPTAADGVVCDATPIQIPGIEDAVTDTGTPTPAVSPTGDPTQSPPDTTDRASDTQTAPDAPTTPDVATDGDATGAGSPAETATEAAGATAAVPVVAAQASVAPAPSPASASTAEATPADPTVSDPAVTASPAPTQVPTDAATGEPSPATPPDFGDGLPPEAPRPVKYVLGPVPTSPNGDELTGSDIEDAVPSLVAQGYGVLLEFDEDGSAAFRAATAAAACERDEGKPGRLAIVLDDIVESAPTMEESVACGVGIEANASISTGSQAAAEDLALVLRAGALPVTLEPATFETVSPTLGSSSLRKGMIAGLLGLVLVALYLMWFYRGMGLIAIGGLLIFGVLVLGLVTFLGRFGLALTLAGVAGIIVSVGITADSSIIYFERIRDEVAVGKTPRLAASRAFSAAWRTNLTGDTATLVAAVVLYFLAVGPVRGFAVTLGLSTLLDFFIMWFYTRSVVGLLVYRGKLGKSIRRRQAADVSVGRAAGGVAR